MQRPQPSAKRKKIHEIEEKLALLRLDESILFLNRAMGVARGYSAPVPDAGALPPVYPHIVHFLAKHLLLNASNLGPRRLTWEDFRELSSLVAELDDPIQHDPGWKNANPSGFFERILHQQNYIQSSPMLQRYGIALGLFRDTGPILSPTRYDLCKHLEATLGTSIEDFMAMGHLTFSLRKATVEGSPCWGTFSYPCLVEAYVEGLAFSVPEVWDPYLHRVACTRDELRTKDAEGTYTDPGDFKQFAFNPLLRFPITEVSPGRFACVDPLLIVERVTRGLFFDLLEQDGADFTERFGHIFDRFIGQVLRSALARELVLSINEVESSVGGDHFSTLTGRRGDWVYLGQSHTILIECKGMHPALELLSTGSAESIAALIRRLTDALRQLTEHSVAIQEGKWNDRGIPPSARFIAIIVTYGKFYTANSPFVRSRISRKLREDGLPEIPLVVLSVAELDSVIRLVELGHSFEDVIEAMATQESFVPLAAYGDELAGSCLSRFTQEKGSNFMDKLRSDAFERG